MAGRDEGALERQPVEREMIDGRRRRHLAAIIILALLLFNAPLVIIAGGVGEGGFLPTYLMAAWGVVIGLAALVLHWPARR